ncbi:cyclase family protein [Cryptosporangium minutisporangium]|uniref:Cyclase family protein n=1 Tax=Cryptosporangium minutisporangium TaxID=113569 RepID=A0ABP6TDJ9_9ACTN
MTLIDLSHVIAAGLITYPGLPAPEITPHLTREASRDVYAPGVEFAIDRITMVGNTGTYLDSPFHRYEGGIDLAGLPLASVADLPTVVVRATTRAVDAAVLTAALADVPDLRGHAVLLHTGGDRHWGTPAYADDAPYLAEDGATYLAEAGVALVGIDSVNIDQVTPEGYRPAHSVLLAAEIPVLEHLTNLAAVPDTGGRLHAAPPPVRDFGTFPVRAYVVV